MKCPNCGQEIQAEHLYCEKCGMEIRIVPDFEPEIENSITETLSTVAEEIEDKKPEKDEQSLEENDEFFTEDQGKNMLTVKIVTLIAAVVIAITVTLLMYINYSASYLIDNAREYAGQGKYEEAIRQLDKAIEKEPGNIEIVLLQSECYYQLGEKDQAAKVLKDLIERERLNEEEAEKVYEEVIFIYDEQGRYEEINQLLLDCPDEAITTVFQRYMALVPEYSYESGSYDEVIYLRLSANTTGIIYYTLDGSTPTEGSEVYTAPIPLESGRYQVNAVFVNDYGSQSDVKRNSYEINLTVPDAPVVMPESGKYEVPTLIEVEIPENGTVYYTTDRSEPGIDSTQYTEPIEMPLGRTNYKFVIISDEGVKSEVASRSYEFAMNTNVSVNTAVSNVVNALIKRNVLLDVHGHATGVAGRYVFRYNSIVQIGESYYYILNEYYIDTNGSETKEERMYAVEVYTGSPNRLIYDEQGQMGLISLTDSK